MPILVYGSETYTWMKTDNSRLTAAAEGFLRSTDRKPERERMRNEEN
jgi:hypothetical protein